MGFQIPGPLSHVPAPFWLSSITEDMRIWFGESLCHDNGFLLLLLMLLLNGKTAGYIPGKIRCLIPPKNWNIWYQSSGCRVIHLWIGEKAGLVILLLSARRCGRDILAIHTERVGWEGWDTAIWSYSELFRRLGILARKSPWV